MRRMRKPGEMISAFIGRVGRERYEEAFRRRPCRRRLRYVGIPNHPDPAQFILGSIYHSVDFNGGTYTIEGDGLMGAAFFEWLKEE